MLPIVIYTISDYFFLRLVYAHCTSSFVNSMGIMNQVRITNGKVLIDFINPEVMYNIEISKDCTQIGVFAIFSGLIIFIPHNSIRRKIITLAIVFSYLFGLNLLRLILHSYFAGTGHPFESFHNQFTIIPFYFISAITISLIIYNVLVQNYLNFYLKNSKIE
ncbi:MAG: hypothetical protein ACTSRC_10755 [Candidatus Helarchaeota archaeon]